MGVSVQMSLPDYCFISFQPSEEPKEVELHAWTNKLHIKAYSWKLWFMTPISALWFTIGFAAFHLLFYPWYETDSLPGIPTFSTHAEERAHILIHTAAVFRDFSRKGFTEGMSGHISVRDPEHASYIWMNPLGKHFGLMTAGDLICLDINTGKVVGGNKVCTLTISLREGTNGSIEQNSQCSRFLDSLWNP